MRSNSRNSEGRARPPTHPPESLESIKCANANARDKSRPHRSNRFPLSAPPKAKGSGQFRLPSCWGLPGHLPPPSSQAEGCRHMAQEAPRLREPPKPIQEPRGCGHRAAYLRRYRGTTRALRRDANRCSDPPKRRARPLPYPGLRLPVLTRGLSLLGRAARHVWGHSGL